MRKRSIVSRAVIAAVAVAGLMSFGAVRAEAQMGGGQTAPHVIASGTGEVRVAPDRATIFIGVQSRATTAAAAAADNSRRQKAVLDTLKSSGVADDQISTTSFNVSPEMQYPQSGAPRVTGYTVSNTVRVDVRRLEDVGKLIDASLGKGANAISGLQFFSSKADSARRAALALAIASARSDAEAMAKAAGGALGGLIELTSESSGPTPRFEAPMMRAASAGVVPTQIDPGLQTITATVNARWTFVAK